MNKMKETIPNRIPSANRATFPNNDKLKGPTGARVSYIPEETSKEQLTETKDDNQKEDKIDILLKIMTNHIKK